jgi:hypothetical protein
MCSGCPMMEGMEKNKRQKIQLLKDGGNGKKKKKNQRQRNRMLKDGGNGKKIRERTKKRQLESLF